MSHLTIHWWDGRGPIPKEIVIEDGKGGIAVYRWVRGNIQPPPTSGSSCSTRSFPRIWPFSRKARRGGGPQGKADG